jgi:HPt (histidine-containing phosphotransfer) domain-containing protein
MKPMLQAFNAGAVARAPEVKMKAQVPPARPAAPTSMGKIFLLVGVAIVVFMAFTVYSVQKEVQGSAQLAAIKDLYFPVLQRLDANIVRIDKIEETYIQVVVAGDKDSIDKATQLGQQADQAFAEMAKLYRERAAETARLREQLKQYQALATQTSLAFLAQSTEDMTPLTTGMNAALAELRKALKAFRQSSYDAFEETLATEEHDARVRLIMGLALGVMNLGFMGVLVFFIRNNMKMMAVIAVQNATLEQRVAERTAQLSQKTSDINAMLQNMKLGVSTVIPGNRIHPEYSSYLRTIFGIEDLANQDLLESLFGQSDLGVDTKDQVAVGLGAILNEDAMMFDLNGHLLPREMSIEAGGQRKIVQMDWSPIVNEQGVIEKVLLITQDVTHLRELELSSAQQKDELETISRIIRISIGKFNEFIESAANFISANRRLITETKTDAQRRDPEVIAALFRNMHTIKGNARTFEFTHITDVAHRAEQTYDRLRKDATAEWNGAEMIAELEAVDSAVTRYVRVNEDKLGRKGRAAEMLTTRGAFVANEQLAQLGEMAAALAGSEGSAGLLQLRQAIDQLGLISLSRLVSGAVDSLSSLASELHKPTPHVDLVNGDMAFNSQFAEALKSCLMHLVRNSLDHGIEAPADRLRAHKPEQGTLRFACERRGDRIELRISDDGRGLALHKLYEKGVAGGLFGSGEQPTCDAVADILFRSGLSTSEAVTHVSGRGVGMDAVRTFLNEQGATIRVALKQAGQTLGFAPFEFIVDVPLAACSH